MKQLSVFFTVLSIMLYTPVFTAPAQGGTFTRILRYTAKHLDDVTGAAKRQSVKSSGKTRKLSRARLGASLLAGGVAGAGVVSACKAAAEADSNGFLGVLTSTPVMGVVGIAVLVSIFGAWKRRSRWPRS